MRSTCPVFTLLIYRLRYSRSYSTLTYLSLIPLVLGVGLATYGDYYFTPMGFTLTLLGVILASVKTVATNRVMTGPLALSPLEVLFRMSPLAFIQSLIYAYITGELHSCLSFPETPDSAAVPVALTIPSSTTTPGSIWTTTSFLPSALLFQLPSQKMLWALAGNGLIAFLLNISSFSTNKNAGALTMTVCGNVKQCLTILLGIVIFGTRVGVLNGLGMLAALAGAAWYGFVELGARGK